jgi:tetratricopeptide (TPR) repeat protein
LNVLVENWGKVVDIATLLIAFFALLAAAGFFRKERLLRSEKQQLLTEKKLATDERDDLAERLKSSQDRLQQVDPETYLEQITRLLQRAEFDRIEQLSSHFFLVGAEAFGRAAEHIAEEQLLNSDVAELADGKEALRFAQIALSIEPESARRVELLRLTKERLRGLKQGEPLQALLLDGLSLEQLNKLSVSCLESGQTVLAELAARKCVFMVGVEFGKDSLNFCFACSQYSICLDCTGQLEKASQVGQVAIKLAAKWLPENNLSHSRLINNYAAILVKLKRFEEAEELYKRALSSTKNSVGSSNQYYAKQLHGFAGALGGLGKWAAAEQAYEELLEVDLATIGDSHPDHATHLSNFASLYFGQENYEKAEEKFSAALESSESASGSSSPIVAIRQINLAAVFRSIKKFERAEQLYKKGIETLQNTLGERHLDIGLHLCSLANLYVSAGEQSNAIPIFEEALSIFVESLPEGDVRVQQVKSELEALSQYNRLH